LDATLENTIIRALIGRLEEFERLFDIALSKVEQQWLWLQPNTEILCIGVQLQHMSGNLEQYVLVNLGYGQDRRVRSKEFELRPEITLEELSSILLSQIKKAKALIQNTQSHQLCESYHVQGFSMTRLEACIHGIEHLNYHLGQIALIIKYFKPQDLGFYPDIK